MMPQHHSAIFHLDHISVAWQHEAGQRSLLDNIDFALFPGQRLGLYGPNGSGKTTLFRCITGLQHPQQGVVRFHGKALHCEKDFHALRCKVGFVLQHADDQLFFPTILEDVIFGPLNLGKSIGEARETALRTLCDLGLGNSADRLTHRLSGGEKRLVALAAVLAMQPEALLLDEPTNDLDTQARQRLINILLQRDTAYIVISHDLDFLSRVCDSFLTIRDRQLIPASLPVSRDSIPAHGKHITDRDQLTR